MFALSNTNGRYAATMLVVSLLYILAGPSPVLASGERPHFAIGDFDGDQLPDLALVQVESYGAPNSKYSIRLQFSGGSGSTIGIEAPLGGLRIDVRDVNGDDWSDLIISSALESQIVAILVNDRHGNFVLAEPGLFPEVVSKQAYFLQELKTRSDEDNTLLQGRSSFGGQTVTSICRNDRIGSDCCPETRKGEAIQRPAHSHLGRSPPTGVFE